jgi:Zn finger protein HypA/HybF involved in hydrogenase expression
MDSSSYCPKCGFNNLHLMSTTNQWNLYCPKCDKRFNQKLEEMDLGVKISKP